MQSHRGKKVAIVCDWIKDWGWAEWVLEQLMEIFPDADIFSSVFFQSERKIFENRKITTTFIQKIPLLNKSHKLALLIRPLAFESLDFSGYDIVISSSSAESKGIITKPHTLHICYCHTPTRYFWSHFHEYLNMMEFGVLNFLGTYLMPKIVHHLRQWDFVAAQRPDIFIANSINTQKRISKYYKRESSVIYPCIDTTAFTYTWEKKDFYLYVWRCIPYKKFDLIVDAFIKNGKKIVLATNTNNVLYKSLIKKSTPNIEWKLNVSQVNLRRLYGEAKWFLFPPEEDFWLVPVEAMASWTPIIAYKKWWALETVLSEKTGIFFDEQTVESLNQAIEKFETLDFDSWFIREHAKQFDKKIFKQNIEDLINKNLKN